MRISVSSFSVLFRKSAIGFLSLLSVFGCGSGGSTTTGATNTTPTTNAYAAAYQKATFASGVTASFPSSCSMTISASGAPYTHQSYYLAPIGMNGGTVVATTPSGIQLMVVTYAQLSANNKAVSATFNVCPSKASTTTVTTGGAIGIIFSGTALFNPNEATGTVALSDNASYTFTQSGVTYTASFLDPCSQHTTGGQNMGGSTWHYHGNPTCWTSVVDGSSNGPSHMIGIALDGFPIYGGRDINGNVVDPSTLDSCNGITSATPEFPSGAYHYVLPINADGTALATSKSSLNCYSGTVNATLSAQMKKIGCRMPMLLASGRMRLPDGHEVSPHEAMAWMHQTMPEMGPGMQMPGMSDMAMAAGKRVSKQHHRPSRNGI